MKDKFIQIIKNKWLRSATLTFLLVAIILCAFFVINWAVEDANLADFDFTEDKIYSISQETEDKLGNMETDVTISIYNMEELEEILGYYAGIDNISNLLNQYSQLNDHIKVEELENSDSKSELKTEYGVDETSAFILISAENREKILFYYDLLTYDYTTYSTVDITEEAITNGILDVITIEKPKIYFLTGHNMYDNSYFSYLQSSLEDEANEVEELYLMSAGKVPEDCDVLVITALKEDIEELERDCLLEYIQNGGEILLLMEANVYGVDLTNFQQVLDEYGVSVSDGFILEGDSTKMVYGAANIILVTLESYSSITKNINMNLNLCLFYHTGMLNIASDEELEEKNVTSEILASVSDDAFYRTDITISSGSKASSDEDAGGATVAALLTKEIDDETTSKLIVFTNTWFAVDVQTDISTQYYTYPIITCDNDDILLNSISYLTEREDTITIRKNSESVTYLVTEYENRVILAVIFGVPVLIIIVGIVIWTIRRRRK